MKLDPAVIKATMQELIDDYKFEPAQVLDIIKMGIKTAFKKDFLGHEKKAQVQVVIDKGGNIKVYREYDVVKDVEYDDAEMSLKDAKKHRSDIKIGETVALDITPEKLEFSRIAAQSAAQTMKQQIKTVERERFFEKFQTKQGELLRARVLRVNQENIVLDIEGVTVVLPPEGQVPNRMYNAGEEIFVFLKQISKGAGGVVLDITQSSTDFIEAVLKKVVPEYEEGQVRIDKIVRAPGKRTKIVVSSADEKIDPVGVFVGQKGSRISSILTLLEGEKLDFIERIPGNDEQFVADALKPAKVQGVDLQGNKAIVTVEPDQKPVAIGKGAANIKLAAQLTGYMIEIR